MRHARCHAGRLGRGNNGVIVRIGPSDGDARGVALSSLHLSSGELVDPTDLPDQRTKRHGHHETIRKSHQATKNDPRSQCIRRSASKREHSFRSRASTRPRSCGPTRVRTRPHNVHEPTPEQTARNSQSRTVHGGGERRDLAAATHLRPQRGAAENEKTRASVVYGSEASPPSSRRTHARVSHKA